MNAGAISTFRGAIFDAPALRPARELRASSPAGRSVIERVKGLRTTVVQTKSTLRTIAESPEYRPGRNTISIPELFIAGTFSDGTKVSGLDAFQSASVVAHESVHRAQYGRFPRANVAGQIAVGGPGVLARGFAGAVEGVRTGKNPWTAATDAVRRFELRGETEAYLVEQQIDRELRVAAGQSPKPTQTADEIFAEMNQRGNSYRRTANMTAAGKLAIGGLIATEAGIVANSYLEGPDQP